MKIERNKASYFIKEGQDIVFDSSAFIELLKVTLNKNAGFRFKAKGFSMSPFIMDGDTITLCRLNDKGDFCLGDMAAFIHPVTRRLTVHRIIGRKRDCYVLKGDSMLWIDGIIKKEDMLAFVEKIERNNKNIFFGNRRTRFLIFFLTKTRLINLFIYLWRILIPLFIRDRIKKVVLNG
ncbi:MAG: S24/S26 family peptidase [Candidatus Omnitrophota bacterium]